MASEAPKPFGVGFLLSQLGAHSAAAFTQAVAGFGISPPHIGLLRAIAHEPGRSQQSLADQFRMVPSRMVVLLDELEDLGLVERQRDTADRRVHLVLPTAHGKRVLARILEIGAEADRALLAGLTATERATLRRLLEKLAAAQGLQPGIHPGYSWLRPQRGRGG